MQISIDVIDKGKGCAAFSLQGIFHFLQVALKQIEYILGSQGNTGNGFHTFCPFARANIPIQVPSSKFEVEGGRSGVPGFTFQVSKIFWILNLVSGQRSVVSGLLSEEQSLEICLGQDTNFF